MPKKVLRRKRKPIIVKTNDPFIREGRTPDYKKPEELLQYLSDRGKIMPKSRTGLTAQSQRYLAVAVKRARHLALLPFVIKAE